MYGNNGRLIIRPSKAELRTDKNIIFKADPYCVFYFGTQKQRTAACKKGGKHPIWNDTIIFDRTSESSLIVQLWDKDVLSKDDFICTGSIDITNLLKSEAVQPVTIDLYNKGEFIGKLFAEVEWSAFEMKSMPQTLTPEQLGYPSGPSSKF